MFWIVTGLLVLVFFAVAVVVMNRRGQGGTAASQDGLRDAWLGSENPYNMARHDRGPDMGGGGGGC